MVTVLFICTANIIRSPLAEYLFRHRIKKINQSQRWQVRSAGVWTRGGSPTDEKVEAYLKELGIEISNHLSQEVNERLLAEADIVLVMERGHREALQIEFPEHATKIYLLSEIQGKKQNVIDPIGGSEYDYRVTFREIRHYLQESDIRIMELIKKHSS